MAKGKKKKSELTFEEKLKAALVPKEEQPYAVPENWCWVFAPSIFNIEYGKGLSSKQLKDSGFPVFGANGVIGYYSDYMYEDEQALMSCRGAYSGVMNKSIKCSFVTSNSLIISPKVKAITTDFIYNLFSALDVSSLISGSAQPQVTVQSFEKYPILLPTVGEQQRIVSRINLLFSQLDEAKDKVQKVIDDFDSRRAAILAQAFSGKLTEKWRKENGHSLDEWKDTILDEVVSGFKYGSSKKSIYENNGMPVLRIPNIGDGVIDFSDMKFLAHENVDAGNQVHENDILIIRSNGSRDLVGKCAIVPALERNYAYASFLIRIKPSEVILPRFLLLYLNSSIAKSQIFIKAKSSSGIHNINSKELGAIKIKIPSLKEQDEIVKLCDELLEKIKYVEEVSEVTVSKIDDVKSAILSKAFRGELGTQDSSDEPAEELLKRILEEAPVEVKKKSTTRKTKVNVAVNKGMLEAVKEAKKISPEKLKEETGLEIDEFYEELKRLTDSGKVKENREGGDVYLEAGDAD